MSERRARKNPGNRHPTAARSERAALAARMDTEPANPHAAAMAAVADDDVLLSRLSLAIADGMPSIELAADLSRHRRPVIVEWAVTKWEDDTAHGPCSACGRRTAMPSGSGFVRRTDQIEGRDVDVSLCGSCAGYVARYGSLTGYLVVALRAIAGYGTGLPVAGLPPRAKAAIETGAGDGSPWSHVNVTEAIAAVDRWYGPTRRDLADEPRTLLGITPYRWHAEARQAVPAPSDGHVFTDDELTDMRSRRTAGDPVAERREKRRRAADKAKAKRQLESLAKLHAMVPASK